MAIRKAPLLLATLAAASAVVLFVPAAGGHTLARPASVPARPGSVYWGAYVGGAQYGLPDGPWEPQSIRILEQHAGKGLSLVEWGQSWWDCDSTGANCGLQPFPAQLFSQVRAHGSIPVLSWGSGPAQSSPDQPAYRLSRIAAGDFDAYLRTWAKAAKKWGHPFFLRFDWEMNLDGEPWGEPANGNQPGDFVRMWRHVHDVFKQVGAKNVTWFWCPNIDFPDQPSLRSLYPGPAYVDWTGLDGYNWGEAGPRPTDHWTAFNDVFAGSLGQLKAIAPAKPVMIGETASSEIGGSKADWITDALGTLPSRFPQVRGVIWFNKNWDGEDWVIETSPSAQAAFAAAIGSSFYTSNSFGHLSHAPIRPVG